MNKKRIFGIIGAAAIAVAVAFNVSAGLNNKALSDLALANIEALAKSEDGDGIERSGWALLIYLGIDYYWDVDSWYLCEFFESDCGGEGPIPCQKSNFVVNCHWVGK